MISTSTTILTIILITTNNKDMDIEILGYYAKDSEDNLFNYEWGADDEFYILHSDGYMIMADPDKYEVLKIGYTLKN